MGEECEPALDEGLVEGAAEAADAAGWERGEERAEPEAEGSDGVGAGESTDSCSFPSFLGARLVQNGARNGADAAKPWSVVWWSGGWVRRRGRCHSRRDRGFPFHFPFPECDDAIEAILLNAPLTHKTA